MYGQLGKTAMSESPTSMNSVHAQIKAWDADMHFEHEFGLDTHVSCPQLSKVIL